jgi:hypothetical protein
MPHALTLSAAAAVAIVGATATGIALGRSAVGEINPVHFQDGQETQFYADMVPNRRADWATVAADEYRQQASAPPPAAAPNATWPVAPAPVHDPKVDRALASAWREAREPAPQPRYVETVVYEQPVYQDPVPARVRRYAHYPVSRDEPPPPPPDWQEPADAGDAATQ